MRRKNAAVLMTAVIIGGLLTSCGSAYNNANGKNSDNTVETQTTVRTVVNGETKTDGNNVKTADKETGDFTQEVTSEENNLTDNDIASKLMETNKVINVTMTSYLSKTTNEAMDTLNIVVIILIISAGGLALVVLYNLNNINVSERIRELSTIKVLGFYDHEVTMYILRENFILTALGIIIGMFMGKILHGFVITTAEADNMMLSPSIYATSFIYSIILTIVFSLIVMFMMHRKLKKINMIDALKSNE